MASCADVKQPSQGESDVRSGNTTGAEITTGQPINVAVSALVRPPWEWGAAWGHRGLCTGRGCCRAAHVKWRSDVQQVRIFAESSKDKVLGAVQELSQTGLLRHFYDVQWLQLTIFTLTTG